MAQLNFEILLDSNLQGHPRQRTHGLVGEKCSQQVVLSVTGIALKAQLNANGVVLEYIVQNLLGDLRLLGHCYVASKDVRHQVNWLLRYRLTLNGS